MFVCRSFESRKRLKEACKNGEVVEDYDSANFSESTDEEEPEVLVEGDFKLRKKIWNKLYKYALLLISSVLIVSH